MIQSGIFDSSAMDIKKLANSILFFVIKKLIEISGVIISLLGVLLFLSLISYNPEDPNFIFPANTEIKNLLGFQGSYTSDLFFQSIGLIAFLVPITLIFTGINIFRRKELFLIIENLFFISIYLILGSLFFSYFYNAAFDLYINGNGGFVGNYFNKTFIGSVISSNEKISYYFLIIIILVLFLISINFNPKNFWNFIQQISNVFFGKKEKNYTNKNEIINEYIPQEEIKNLIQEDLPFIKAENNNTYNKNKFKLPSLDLLKTPKKIEKEKSDKNENNDPEFLEKILLDFGVNGNIKKVSHGPVVTLNEFEPAAGIKVSKIINLSDDIARNTSSESARISTIPGRNTIGIELPNSLRENVYLSEILNNSDFKKKDIKLPIALGKNISGIPIIGDLTSMPHLLIAGTTGSGKSVCINTIILSLLYRHTPEKCKFILIDPKMLELSTYEGVPHLLCPVITEAKKIDPKRGTLKLRTTAAIALRPKLKQLIEQTYLTAVQTNISEYDNAASWLVATFKKYPIPEEFKEITELDLTTIQQLKRAAYLPFEDLGNQFANDLAQEVYNSTLTATSTDDMVSNLRGKINGVYQSSNNEEAQELVDFIANNPDKTEDIKTAAERLNTIFPFKYPCFFTL